MQHNITQWNMPRPSDMQDTSKGNADPCLFYNPKSDVAIMVHGDDFVGLGHEEHLKHTRKILEDKYKLKVEMLGTGVQDQVRILNKVVRYGANGVEIEADPRHVEAVIRDLGLEGAKPSMITGNKVKAVD